MQPSRSRSATPQQPCFQLLTYVSGVRRKAPGSPGVAVLPPPPLRLQGGCPGQFAQPGPVGARANPDEMADDAKLGAFPVNRDHVSSGRSRRGDRSNDFDRMNGDVVNSEERPQNPARRRRGTSTEAAT
jgi:hypothetical protein